MFDLVAIDADSFIYQLGGINKMPVIHFGQGNFKLYSNKDLAIRDFHKYNKPVQDAWIGYPVEFLTKRLRLKLEFIKKVVPAKEYKIILSGRSSDRHKRYLYPEYKSGRIMSRPPAYATLRDYLIKSHGAILTDRCEADDYVCQLSLDATRTVAVSVDKDVIYLHPGTKFNPMARGLFFISKEEALQNFIYFLLSGDAGDGIPGLNGVGEPSFNKKTGVLIDSSKAVKLYNETVLIIKEFKSKPKTYQEKAYAKINDIMSKDDYYSLVLSKFLIAFLIYKNFLKGLRSENLYDYFSMNAKLLGIPIVKNPVTGGFITYFEYIETEFREIFLEYFK